METQTDPFLAEVESFLTRTGVSPTAFGVAAVNDPRFVFDLRGGRECRRSTRNKIREKMPEIERTACSTVASTPLNSGAASASEAAE